MYLDVIELRRFYSTPLGALAARLIRRRLRLLWPDVSAMSVLGIGYAPPYLCAFRQQAGRVLAMMPGPQGVVPWPPGGRNLAALVEEVELPLPDAAIDRVILVHALENSDQTPALLRDVWRVMAPGGRLIVVVPNRRSLWARLERTPFGHGRPYSVGQLSRLFDQSLFSPVAWSSALFIPPTNQRLILGAFSSLEDWGVRYWRNFTGVLVVEAEKRIYAGAPPEGRRQLRRAPAYPVRSG